MSEIGYKTVKIRLRFYPHLIFLLGSKGKNQKKKVGMNYGIIAV